MNAYGPIECADDITHMVLDQPLVPDPVPIGRPIANVTLEVTDDWGRLVPFGVEGELRVSGACLGLGYLDAADEADRFLRSGGATGHVCAYRTGDRVRFNSDGDLVWLGRGDREVKVRGRRIELGDIETHARSHPAVSQAAAVVVGSGGGRLRCVVVPRTGQRLDRDELLRHLAAHVPAWMLPDEVVIVDSLPATSHGKLDRASLAVADLAHADAADPTPPPATQIGGGDIADAVGEEWANITGRTPAPGSDFFAEGASSLDGVRLAARVGARVGVEVTVADLLQAPTFTALTDHVRTRVTGYPGPTPSKPALAHTLEPGVAGVIAYTTDRAEDLLTLVPGGRLDAAAVGCLTPAALRRSGQSSSDVLTRLGDEPVLRRVLVTPHGNVGHFLLPMLSDEIVTARQRLASYVRRAAAQAAEMGAQRCALTGLIAAALDYGRHFRDLPTGAITTGHDVTAAAVVLTVQRALRATATRLAEHRVAMVGLGSVGRAASELLVAVLGKPAHVILVEAPGARDRLNAATTGLRGAGYTGPVRCLSSTPRGVPPEVYDHTLIIGAASVAGILEVGHLAAGTVVVDDSAPHIFDVPAAVGRAEAGQLYVTEAGVLQWPSPLREVRWTPIDPILAATLAALRTYRPKADIAMGCLVAGLPGLHGDMEPVLGPPSPAQTLTAYQALRKHGIQAAPPMLEDILLPAGGGADHA